jgi:hypothetical protein
MADLYVLKREWRAPYFDLSAMADLKVFAREDSLLDLLQKIYHHYAGMSVPLLRMIMVS